MRKPVGDFAGHHLQVWEEALASKTPASIWKDTLADFYTRKRISVFFSSTVYFYSQSLWRFLGNSSQNVYKLDPSKGVEYLSLRSKRQHIKVTIARNWSQQLGINMELNKEEILILRQSKSLRLLEQATASCFCASSFPFDKEHVKGTLFSNGLVWVCLASVRKRAWIRRWRQRTVKDTDRGLIPGSRVHDELVFWVVQL